MLCFHREMSFDTQGHGQWNAGFAYVPHDTIFTSHIHSITK